MKVTSEEKIPMTPRLVRRPTPRLESLETRINLSPPTVVGLQIDDGTVQRSMITSLTITFSEAVSITAPIANAFLLHRDSAPPSVFGAEQGGVTGYVNLSAVQTGAVVTVTFNNSGPNPIKAVGGGPGNGASIPDGRYTLTIDHSQVVGVDGNMAADFVLASAPAPAAPTNIFRFFGDVNGDGAVMASDYKYWLQYFGGANHVLDYDGDGAVAASDFRQFRLRFGGNL
jgi:hypothetical protein